MLFDGKAITVNRKVWLNGSGCRTSPVMIVCDKPSFDETRNKSPFSGSKWKVLKSIIRESGLTDVYMTYVCKYFTNRKLTSSDISACSKMLSEEVEKYSPSVIVCLGSVVLNAVAGNGYPISQTRGSVIVSNGRKILPTFEISELEHHPELDEYILRDLKLAARVHAGEDISPQKIEINMLRTPRELHDFTDMLLSNGNVLIALDCEWDGDTWMDPGRYFRTIQIGTSGRTAYVIEISAEGGRRLCDENAMFSELKRLLEDDRTSIVGQNVIADGEWLLSYGIDIRPHVIYDTMLAEYIIDSDVPVGLEELSMKYCPEFGRYSTDVELWVKHHAKECIKGYGNVPRDMLMSYSGYDVCALFRIMSKQIPVLQERGYMKPRGDKGQYPSLLRTTLRMQEIIYELEINGMPVDMQRLKDLIDIYQKKRSELMSMLTTEAAVAGMPDFNPNSTDDKRELLYGKLGITPIRTTDGKDWGEVAGNVGMDDNSDVKAGTDKNTLAVLAQQHPVAKHLIHFNAVNQICKTWMKYPDKNGEGGLIADLWEDGKIHSHFGQMTSTGRLRTSSPNSQNFPKRAEGVIKEVFGDSQPPSLRTIVKPPEGWMMIEGDFCQAELFTLANLSQDPNMLKVLNTPGMDLHDKSAVDGFGFRMEDEDGNEITLDDLVRIAEEEKDNGGENSERFQHIQKTITYIDQKGKRYSRSEFKSGPRIAAKAISFSVPYGISAAGLSWNIKSQTGDQRPLSEINAEISKLIDAWKFKSYPVAWKSLVSWQQRVYDPGYIDNPWGRRKWLRVRPGSKNTALEREAGNFP